MFPVQKVKFVFYLCQPVTGELYFKLKKIIFRQEKNLNILEDKKRISIKDWKNKHHICSTKNFKKRVIYQETHTVSAGDNNFFWK